MRTTTLSVLFVAALALASCGSDDDSSSADTDGAEPASTEAQAPSEDTAPADDESATPPAGGSGIATLTLENGESFEFSVRCALEPQTAAGSEILFTATSIDDPGLDITQFGDEGPITDLGTISVFNGSFDTLWEASSIFEAFGGNFELSLDGSTIRGAGSFYAGADPAATPLEGEVTANC